MQSDPSQVAADQKEQRRHREEEIAGGVVGAAAVGAAGYETYEVSKQPTNQPLTYHSILCVCVCVCVFVNRFWKDLSRRFTILY